LRTGEALPIRTCRISNPVLGVFYEKLPAFPSGFQAHRLSILAGMSALALTELLGAPVIDSGGHACGRVREVALTPQEDRIRISVLIVKTRGGDRVVPLQIVTSINGGVRTSTTAAEWALPNGTEGLFLLERDLLDQQVIDVHGRKVVRVNDVDLHQESVGNRWVLKVASVDVGARGAIRRLLKGVVPMGALHVLLSQIPPRSIPWDFVDLIETDPARRVRLKISHERLAKLHPADIADIVEDLAPDEREAVFETLDEGVAAGALERPSSSRWTRTAWPRLSKKCSPMPPPTCWRTCRTRGRKRFWRRWRPRRRRKFPDCWNSRKTLRPAG
jgi:sporulation protein YlmC with PRC-barrel domain